MANYKFPEGFLWGSATSAGQIENASVENAGGKADTIWEQSFKLMPERFFEETFVKNDFLNRYPEDLAIAKNLNFNSLRVSISWARLMPDGINVNQEAVDYYNKLLDEMEANGLERFVGLYHFDMPTWAQDKGGWLNREVVEKYVEFTAKAFELFGSKVEYWATFNEPIVLVEGQQWYDFHYPFNVDFKDGIIAMMNINLAHALAMQEFRKSGLDSKCGIILNITPAIPRSQNKADLRASELSELFQWRCFSDTTINGKFPQKLVDVIKEKGLWPEEINIDEYNAEFAKTTIDYLGINFYHPLRVKALDYTPEWDEDKSAVLPQTHFYSIYDMPNKRMNPYRGWEIYPKAVYMMLKTIQNEYGNIPCYIAENGMGVQDESRFREDGMINDHYRIDFHSEHLYWIQKAIEEGSSCFGYHMWTYIDNWSWCNAYKNRYGYIELDLETGERKEKKSASWIREVIKTNSVDWK